MIVSSNPEAPLPQADLTVRPPCVPKFWPSPSPRPHHVLPESKDSIDGCVCLLLQYLLRPCGIAPLLPTSTSGIAPLLPTQGLEHRPNQKRLSLKSEWSPRRPDTFPTTGQLQPLINLSPQFASHICCCVRVGTPFPTCASRTFMVGAVLRSGCGGIRLD